MRFASVLLVLAFFAAPVADAQLIVPKKIGLPPITRAELVSNLLHARLGDTLPAIEATRIIPDVPPNAWYRQAMIAAEQYGMVTPDANGNLRPDATVTRAEFLRMATIVFDLEENLPHAYSDVPPDSEVARYAGSAMKHGFFGLDPDQTTLSPSKPLSRHEASILTAWLVIDTSWERRAEPELDRQLASAQSAMQLDIYSVMSTARKMVVMVWPEEKPPEAELAMPRGSPTVEELRDDVLALVNEKRAAEGMKPLRMQTTLEDSAQRYAKEMATGGFFSHVSPSGQTLKQRMQNVGYDTLYVEDGCNCVRAVIVGENLARGQKTPEKVVADWMQSASHRKTILTPEYSDIGIGIASGYWVQHFGGVIAAD